MGTTSYIHDVIKNRNKKANRPYMGSILIKNENIPLFEEYFGQLDYDWVLRVTKYRKCKEVETSVIRYVDGKNLSLDPTYRKRDFYMGLLDVDGNIPIMKKWYSTRARYHYVMHDMKIARFFFLRGQISLKTILYIISSYNLTLSKLIIKIFKVFG